MNCSNDDLYYLASDFGEVEYVELPTNIDGTKNKGYAFVKFKKALEASKFLKYLSDVEFMGKKV